MPLSSRLALLAALALGLVLPRPAGARPPLSLAMQSPWWEQYEQKDRYLCPNRGVLVLERNDAQASLISGRSQVILFREAGDTPGARYRNGPMRVILQGDELTFEQLPMRLVCQRTVEG